VKYKLRIWTDSGVLSECLLETEDPNGLCRCLNFGVFPQSIRVDIVEVESILDPKPDHILEK
jgi:hypothetical protein